MTAARVRVKICGITRHADAQAAVDAGADALGFVLWKGSPRCVTTDQARSLAAGVPPYVARVGVFVDEAASALAAAMREAGLSVAQLHGDEGPEYCRSLDVPWYRAFRIGSGTEAAAVADEIAAYGGGVFMLDAAGGTAPGGTGRAFDWRLAARLSVRTALAGQARLILAGGLDPDNVGEAIKLARPWAVDVSSGVESSPGVKDPERIRAFMDAVRASG